MSYQVIARKYRPQRFEDVVGQEHVSTTLANAIRAGRVAHAYLFCGPRGTGKTTTARIVAKALNCTGGPRADFDVADPKCVEIAEGRSLDVIEIDGASNNGVDQVRDLRDSARFAPASSKFKIYIIDEVHMLSTAAFNALLKTLEEPPAHVKFLFATTDPEKVLPTILSRCQRFDLRRIPAALIVRHLAAIAKQEGVAIDDAALYAIARGADGGMRDAEGTLDQLISFCGNQIAEADVLSMFGLAARAQILALSGAVLAGNVEPALRELDQLAKSGKDLGRLLGDLLNHFRNLLIFQVSKGDLALLEISEAEAAALGEQSKSADAAALTRILEVLTDTESRLRDAASRKILLEVALLKAIQARNAVPIDTVIKQLQQLRTDRGAGGSTGPASPAPAAPATSSPGARSTGASAVAAPTTAQVPAATPPPPQPMTLADAPVPEPPADLSTLWQRLVEGASPFLRSYLLEAHPVSLAAGVLTIGFDPEFADHIGLVDNAKNHGILQQKLTELGVPGAMVRFVKAEAPAPRAPVAASANSAPTAIAGAQTKPVSVAAPVPAAAPRATKEDFKNDPLIQSVLAIFMGQIVERRG
ncbi:MAG: DNA polymerase III subunit gamma/tau [Verrucomicrobia bacterium]|nr:DNA polymerase III subunit gamma/tau [Verrucomicrobiota bacterium]